MDELFTYNIQTNLRGIQRSLILRLRVPGLHNMKNAMAALAVVSLLGLSIEDAAATLSEFVGTDRRFNTTTSQNGVHLINDYAHHPTEIQATLQAVRQKYPKSRVWAVWQPHTYSRTKTLFYDFARSFGTADRVIVSKIYASRESDEEFSASQVVDQMKHPAVEYIPELSDITNTLRELCKPEDVVIVMSAGDADKIIADLSKRATKEDRPT